VIIDLDGLIEFIDSKGGEVSLRVAQRDSKMFKTAHETEKAIIELIKAGRAEWVRLPSGTKNKPVRGVKLLDATSLRKVGCDYSKESIQDVLYELARKFDEIGNYTGDLKTRNECMEILKQLSEKFGKWRASE